MEKLFIEEKITQLRNNIARVVSIAEEKMLKVEEDQKPNLEKFKEEIVAALNNMLNEIESKAKSSNNEKAIQEYLRITGEKLDLAVNQTINRINEFKEKTVEETIDDNINKETIFENVEEETIETNHTHCECDECECDTECECQVEESHKCDCDHNNEIQDLANPIETISEDEQDIINIKKIVKEMYEDNHNEEINRMIKEVKLATSIINKNVEEGLNLEILKNDPLKAREVVIMIFEKTLNHLKNQLNK